MFEKLKEKKAFRPTMDVLGIAFWLVVVIISIWVVIAFASPLLHGKNVMEGFVENIKFSIPLLLFFAAIGIIGFIIGLIKFLIDIAVKNPNKKTSLVTQIILFICIFYVGIIVIAFFVQGLHWLYKESLEMFIAFVCCAAYSIYFWYSESEKNKSK